MIEKMKGKRVRLKILSIDFQNGITVEAELIEEAVQTTMFPEGEKEQIKTSPPPLTDGQIQSLVKHGHYSVEEVLDMPRGVALVRLGNVIGEYKARQDGHMFTPTQKFPEGVPPDYQDPWLNKTDPVSFGERRAPQPLFNFKKYETLPSGSVLSPVDALKRKRGRPRKPPVNVI